MSIQDEFNAEGSDDGFTLTYLQLLIVAELMRHANDMQDARMEIKGSDEEKQKAAKVYAEISKDLRIAISELVRRAFP